MQIDPPKEEKRESFEAWMGRALFDPMEGYYSARVKEVGAAGDFSTSATISPVLAAGVASWIVTQLQKPEHAKVRTIVEIGGGSGQLMREVRSLMGRWFAWRKGLRWIMVETSVPLIKAQKRQLRGWQTRWVSHPQEAMMLAEGKVLIYHHELVDAFPVQLWRWSADLLQWGEIGVKSRGSVVLGEWVEYDDERKLPASRAFSAEMWPADGPPNGQRVEIQESYRRWCEAWMPQWERGAMLTLDYGDLGVGLYDRRPQGTLRAYHQHQRLEGKKIYHRMGHQDVTSDVNFTDLIHWGSAQGLRSEPLLSLREFLLAHGAERACSGRKEAAQAYVLDPLGVGSAFKALVQYRGEAAEMGSEASLFSEA